jgi:hypothetical protein
MFYIFVLLGHIVILAYILSAKVILTLNLIGIDLFRKLIRAIKSGKLEDIKAKIATYIANFGLNLFYFYKIMFFLDFRGKKC